MRKETGAPNAQEYLSRGYRLDQAITSKLDQIEFLRSLACRVNNVLSNAPIDHTRNITSLQDTVIRITETEESLNADINQLISVREEIKALIAQVSNQQCRMILEKRYLGFHTFEEIGNDLGISGRWAKDRHRQALQMIQGMLDARERKHTGGSRDEK